MFDREEPALEEGVKATHRTRMEDVSDAGDDLPTGTSESDGNPDKEPSCEEEADEIEEGDRIFATRIYREESTSVRATETISQRLAEAFAKNSESAKKKSLRDHIPESFWDYEDVFAKESFDSLPEHRKWDHAIELVGDPQSPTRKLYPLSPAEQSQLDEFIKENLESGRIRPSKSPMASPFFFVKKKDGSLRPVQDYRALNNITVKNRYPLPLIDDLVHRLSGAKYFTKLDVRWGYNNIRIREGDEWKAAFRTNRGMFEPLVMFFGLCNSPATFQTMMNDILADLIDEGSVCVYLDDILIFTKTLEEHRRIVRRVLERLREHKLYLKAEKCEFLKTSIEYLGVIVSENRVEMDPVKVAGVAEWPQPKNRKEVQSFLGFVNFYRRFIADFSHHARPLFDLTKKDTPFAWGQREQESFLELKSRVTSAPVLSLPDHQLPFRLEADSSDFATGAVLSQPAPQSDTWHPVAFLSKSLNEVERNYEIHDKEMLAVIRALEEWRHFLEGAQHPFAIWTDHKNLEYFRKAQKLNRRQARWSLFLSQFNFTLHHRPGKSMGKPDALSRRADHGQGKEDNKDIVLLSPSLFRVHALTAVSVTGGERDILKDIKRATGSTQLEEAVAKAAKELRKDKQRGVVKKSEWEESEGLLMFNGKVYVPEHADLRRRILAQHHDSKVAGHPGRWKTLELVSRNYWWPNMSRFVGTYTRTCDSCLRNKVQRRKPIGELHPLPTPTAPWEVVSVDFIVELPESRGYDAVLTMVDSAGKRGHFLPTTTTVTAEGAANIYYREIFRLHGLPRKIISDRGPQFVAKFMQEIARLLGIELAHSTAYHPQTDGQTERVNQEIEQYIRLFVNHHQDDWHDLMPTCEFAYNNHVHSSTQQTPFYLDTGRHPRMGFEPQLTSNVESVNEFRDRMKNSLEEAKAALTKAKEDYALYYNRRHTPAPEFKAGDKVYLDAADIRTDRPTKKFDALRYGPFKVLAKVGSSSYRLQLPSSMSRLHPVFPVVKLTPVPADPFPARRGPPPPPPVVVDGEREYEVEEILDSRRRWNRVEYLIKWKGYPSSENSWRAHHQVHADQQIRKFLRKNPLKESHFISALNSLFTLPRGDLYHRHEDLDWRGTMQPRRGDEVLRRG
jgi:transposase InsO family protein